MDHHFTRKGLSFTLIIITCIIIAAACRDSQRDESQSADRETPAPVAREPSAIMLAIRDLVLAGDADGLLARVSFYPRACTSIGPDDPGQAPCPSGASEGTEVQSFFVGACGEGTFPPKGSDQVRSSLRSLVAGSLALQAIVEGSVVRGVPGTATLIFKANGGNELEMIRAVVVDANGVSGFRFGCGLTIDGLIGPNPTFIVPPRS